MVDKDEALRLADKLDGLNSCEPVIIKACEDMIRKLLKDIEELESYVLVCKRCGDDLGIKYEEIQSS